MASERLRELLPEDSIQANEYTPASEILKLIRQSHLHRPDCVLSLGEKALSQTSANSVEHWNIQEQISVAAAECGYFDLLTATCKKIVGRFLPHLKSSRARLTHGLRREGLNLWNDAMKSYIDILVDDPMCHRAYKRQIAVFKSQRRIPEAIAQLNHYLSYFSTDADAWSELAALCLESNRSAHALYAANELIVCDPNNHAAHTMTADIYLSSGAPTDVVQARKHYAASLSARPDDNLRALYGLWYAANIVSGLSFAQSKEEKELNAKLLSWACKKIEKIYTDLDADIGVSNAYSFVTEVIHEPIPDNR